LEKAATIPHGVNVGCSCEGQPIGQIILPGDFFGGREQFNCGSVASTAYPRLDHKSPHPKQTREEERERRRGREGEGEKERERRREREKKEAQSRLFHSSRHR